MTTSSERRRLRSELLDIGVAGLALLRLHAARDPGPAPELIEHIREALARVDGDESLEVSNPLADVVTGYKRWAAVYDVPGNPLVESEEPVVRSMLDELEGDPVLDAACGTGRHLAYLTARGHSVIGSDLSADMLGRARDKVPTADLRLGDLLHLPLSDGEAASVVCALAVEHVADIDGVYAELARVVTPGGSLIVSTLHPVMRSVLGWGAWFVDAEGRLDVPSYPHGFEDHVRASNAAGLTLRYCAEPTAAPSFLAALDAAKSIVYSALPMVLVLKFEKE